MFISWPDNDMCSKLESEFLTSAFISQKLPLSYLVYTIRLESVVCGDGHMSLCGQDQTDLSFLVVKI